MPRHPPLAPHLPARPLTPEQLRRFNEYLPLARRAEGWGTRKYGIDNRLVLRSAALTGLLCACERFQEDDGRATFKTYAVNVINWTMRLEVRREAGKRNAGRKLKRDTYEPSAYRAAGDLPEVADVWDEDPIPITTHNPELAYQAAERTQLAKTILATLEASASPRLARMLERRMDGETLEAIGRDYRITRERTRQLVNKAIEEAQLVTSRRASEVL